jgi:hypothetical protein
MEKKDTFVLRHLAAVQPDLWWLDSDPLEPEPHPALIGDLGADLCIVGAGYTGLWTALLAKERDPKRSRGPRAVRNRRRRLGPQRRVL